MLIWLSKSNKSEENKYFNFFTSLYVLTLSFYRINYCKIIIVFPIVLKK